jgi:hypothetical protein
MTPINRPHGDSPRGRGREHLLPSLLHTVSHYTRNSRVCDPTFACFLCLGFGSLRLLDPNIWLPLWVKHEDNPNYATKTIEPTTPSRRRSIPNLCLKPINRPPTHSPKPYPPSSKDLNIQPSAIFLNSSYTNQLQCPLQQRAPARMAEEPVQPKPTEVTHINHP